MANSRFFTTGSAMALLAIGFVALDAPAMACANCGYAIISQSFPPILPWTLVALGWFLTQKFLRVVCDKEPRLSQFWIPVLFSMFAVRAGGAMTLPPLAILCAMACVRTKFWLGGKNLDFYAKATLSVALVAVVLFAVTAPWAYSRSAKMDRIDKINRWGGTVLGQKLLEEMESEGKSALPELRRVLQNPPQRNPYLAQDAAEIIGRIGDAEIDVPILIDAYASAQRSSGTSGSAPLNRPIKEFDIALRDLSKLRMPQNASLEEWRKAWEVRDEAAAKQEPEPDASAP